MWNPNAFLKWKRIQGQPPQALFDLINLTMAYFGMKNLFLEELDYEYMAGYPGKGQLSKERSRT
jgi:hypothetical protein